MGSNGRALVESDYSWDSVVRKFAATDDRHPRGPCGGLGGSAESSAEFVGEPNLECHR
jgi:hypothetical protein